MVKHIAFTLYPVKDMARARKFYEEGLGLALTAKYEQEGGAQWIEYHLDNGAFAITTMKDVGQPAADKGGSIAFEVDDVDAAAAKLLAAGGKPLVPAFDSPVCRIAVVGDTEGNGLLLHKKHPGR